MSTIMYWATVSCVKISTVKVILYLGASMDFCLYYPRLISDLGDTQYKKPEINASEHLRVFLKTGTGKAILFAQA
jgi:hypothetical protein